MNEGVSLLLSVLNSGCPPSIDPMNLNSADRTQQDRKKLKGRYPLDFLVLPHKILLFLDEIRVFYIFPDKSAACI